MALVTAAAPACPGESAPLSGATRSVVSWSELQTAPGLTERTIRGRGQVHARRLPANVTHTGALHAELTSAPADCDRFACLLGTAEKCSAGWRVCPATGSQGFRPLVPGREGIDHTVPEALDRTPTARGVRGDECYAVVQASNGVSCVRLTGYLPRVGAGQTDTMSEVSATRRTGVTRRSRPAFGSSSRRAAPALTPGRARMPCRRGPAGPTTHHGTWLAARFVIQLREFAASR
jgi:hypothetical protein